MEEEMFRKRERERSDDKRCVQNEKERSSNERSESGDVEKRLEMRMRNERRDELRIRYEMCLNLKM